MGRRPAPAFLYSLTGAGLAATTVIVAVIPDILDDLGGGPATGGLLLAAGTAPGIFMAPVLGWLADRIGRRRVVRCCLLLVALTGLLMPVATSVEALVAIRLAQGLGSVALANLALVLIGDHWSGPERLGVLSRNAAVMSVAAAAGPLVGGTLGQAAGWRATSLPYLALLPLVLVAGRQLDGDAPRATVAVRHGGGVTALDVATIRRTVVLVALHFVLYFGLLQTIVPTLAADEHGISAGWRGALIGAAAVPSAVAALVVGRDRARVRSRESVVARACALQGAAALALVLVGAPAVLLIAVLALGIGSGGAVPVLQQQLALDAPPHARGVVTALWASGVRTGQTAGPLAAGLVIEHAGIHGAIVAAGLAATAAALGLTLAQRQQAVGLDFVPGGGS